MILNPLYLVDATETLYIIEAETRVNNDRTTFAMSSHTGHSCGQCYFEPCSEWQQKLLDLWETYHLKDVTDIDIEEKYNDIANAIYIEMAKRAVQCSAEMHGMTAEYKAAAVIQEYVREHTSVTPSLALIFHDLKYDPRSHTGSSLNWNFWIGTEEELCDEAEKYLIEDRSIWVEAVKGGSTDQGLVDWAKDVVRLDGWDATLDGMWGYGVGMDFADRTGLACCCR